VCRAVICPSALLPDINLAAVMVTATIPDGDYARAFLASRAQ
jgi:hypothetical protein